MAADEKASGADGDLSAVESRLRDLHAKVDQVEAAASSAKLTGRLITVLIILAAVIGVYLLLSPFISAYKDKDSYTKALQSEFTERVGPTLQTELEDSIKTVGPEVAKLVVERMGNRREDVLAAVDHEATLLMDNLQGYTEEALAETVVDVEQEMLKRLREMIPQIDDPDVREKILGNSALALENAVKRVVEEKLGSHIEDLIEIENQLMAFPVPDTIKGMSDTELSDELNRALAEYALVTLRTTFTPETRELLKKLGEEPK